MNKAAIFSCIVVFILQGITFFVPLQAVAADTDNVCIKCHGLQTGRLGKPVELWRSSIHAENGIACNNCHGGDPLDAANAMSPARGFTGKPKTWDIPGLCGRCHIGVLKDYLASSHGKMLGRGGPTCVTCHGNHLVRKATIELINEKDCAKCHDFERGRKIRENMADIESRIVSIERRLSEFKMRGIDTDQMGKSLFAVRNRFHTLFHELDIGRLKVEAAGIDNDLGKILLSVKKIDEEEHDRKLAGIAAIAAALLVALLVRMYGRTFK